MAQAQTFIGAHISLTSTSDIRYRGILFGINHQDSTIQLQNVYSMGTEGRRPPAEYLPPNPNPYDFIVFRATEVKDLAVEKHAASPPVNNVHNDPAVLGASGGSAPPQPPPPSAQPPPVVTPTPPAAIHAPVQSNSSISTPEPPAAAPPVPQVQVNVAPTASGSGKQRPPMTNGRDRERSSASVRSAEASLDSVEKALGDLRVNAQANTGSGGGNGGGRDQRGRRGGGHPSIRGPGVVPDTPFDFAGSNAKFDKTTLAQQQQQQQQSNSSSPPSANGSVASGSAASPPATENSQFYNKTASFFDDISSDAKARSLGQTPGGPGVARSRREEERNKNLSTFGETAVHNAGNVPLNYNRRGTRRRQPGGGAGRGSSQPQ